MAVVLVTGGAGYIGSHTCVALIDAGHRPVVIDDLSHGRQAALDRIGRLTGRVPTFVRADVRDGNAVLEAMRAHAVEAVIHLAGRKVVGESARDPLTCYSNNVSGTLAVLNAMRLAGITRLVYSSSCAIYGNAGTSPVSEAAAISPTSPYGHSKVMAETILRHACAADASLAVRVLRYFNPVGAHPSGAIGEDPFGIATNLMPCIAQVAVRRREQLPIFGTDYPTRDGTAVRDFIHVMDVAEGHVAALRASGPPAFETYNLGTGRGASVLEVVGAFEYACSRPIARRNMPRREGDVAEIFADPALALAVLEWRARRTLEEMCVDAWRWQRENPGGYGS